MAPPVKLEFKYISKEYLPPTSGNVDSGSSFIIVVPEGSRVEGGKPASMWGRKVSFVDPEYL